MKPVLLSVHENRSKLTHTDTETQVSWKCWIWTSKRLRRKNLLFRAAKRAGSLWFTLGHLTDSSGHQAGQHHPDQPAGPGDGPWIAQYHPGSIGQSLSELFLLKLPNIPNSMKLPPILLTRPRAEGAKRI